MRCKVARPARRGGMMPAPVAMIGVCLPVCLFARLCFAKDDRDEVRQVVLQTCRAIDHVLATMFRRHCPNLTAVKADFECNLWNTRMDRPPRASKSAIAAWAEFRCVRAMQRGTGRARGEAAAAWAHPPVHRSQQMQSQCRPRALHSSRPPPADAHSVSHSSRL